MARSQSRSRTELHRRIGSERRFLDQHIASLQSLLDEWRENLDEENTNALFTDIVEARNTALSSYNKLQDSHTAYLELIKKGEATKEEHEAYTARSTKDYTQSLQEAGGVLFATDKILEHMKKVSQEKKFVLPTVKSVSSQEESKEKQQPPTEKPQSSKEQRHSSQGEAKVEIPAAAGKEELSRASASGSAGAQAAPAARQEAAPATAAPAAAHPPATMRAGDSLSDNASAHAAATGRNDGQPPLNETANRQQQAPQQFFNTFHPQTGYGFLPYTQTTQGFPQYAQTAHPQYPYQAPHNSPFGWHTSAPPYEPQFRSPYHGAQDGQAALFQAALINRIPLPKFDGQLTRYPEFLQGFLGIVGPMQMNGAGKLALLKESLSGEPKNLIDGLTSIDANFDIALNILQRRYNKPQLINDALIWQLEQIRPCGLDGKGFNETFVKIQSIVLQLQPEGMDDGDSYLFNMILCRLPNLRLRAMRERQRKAIGVTELLRMAEELIEEEQIDQLFPLSLFGAEQPPPPPRKTFGTRPPTGTGIRCKLCNNTGHYEESCTQYTTTRDRETAILQMNLCRNCLVPGHSAVHCRNVKSCRVCRSRHHTCVCTQSREPRWPPREPQAAAPWPRQQQPSYRGYTTTAAPAAPQTNAAPRQGNNAPQQEPQAPQPSDRRRNQPRAPRMQQNAVNFSYDDRDETTFLVQGDTASGIIEAASANENGTAADRKKKRKKRQKSSKLNEAAENHVEKKDNQSQLLCANVLLRNPDKPELTATTTVLLDTGSTSSYISASLAVALQLKTVETNNINVYSFGSTTPTTRTSNSHDVSLQLSDKSFKHMHVKSTLVICNKLDWIRLNEKEETVPESSQPGLLIGCDQLFDLLVSPDFSVQKRKDGTYLINSQLGPLLAGRMLSSEDFQVLAASCHTPPQQDEEFANLEKLVENFWKLESLGIEDSPMNTDDHEALKTFKETIAFDEASKRYSVTLPFKTDPSKLPSNFSMAYSRLVANHKKLSKQHGLIEKYDAIFQEQLRFGILEEVPPHEAYKEHCHYLPHHGITKESSETTKLRCVIDGSAKTAGESSLNELLHRGPVLLPNLIGVLLRTRTAPILLVGDLEKAFLQVGVQEQHRDYTRVLWLKDPTRPPSRENLLVLRYARVSFGLICSPFLLAGTILTHFDAHPTENTPQLKRNLYVDNTYTSAVSEKEAIEMFHSIRELFAGASMNWRECLTNSSTVNEHIRAIGAGNKTEHTTILGLKWNAAADEYCLAPMPDYTTVRLWTKRIVLKFTSSPNDPLGWSCPSSLPIKHFQQSLWKTERPWDEPLEETLVNEWLVLIAAYDPSLIKLPRLAVPFPRDSMQLELHAFVDASGYAYGAVVYIAARRPDGQATVHLLLAKNRLAPLKGKIAIPRLELIANVLGSTIMKHVADEIDVPITAMHQWTDSRIALSWITGGKRLPVFINNRVKRIKQLTPTTKFHHIRGSDNPADICSRGCTSAELQDCPLWFNGPPFLTRPQSEWPLNKDPIEKENIEETVLTAASKKKHKQSREQTTSEFIDFSRFSSWKKLLHVFALVLRFAVNTSASLRKKFGRSQVKLLRWAELKIVQLAQARHPPTDTVIRQLNLARCSTTRLWRSQGRIDNAELDYDTKNPLYLPKESAATELYILHVHSSLHHAGAKHTLDHIRKQYWIPRGTTAVHRIIFNKCFQCKRKNARPYALAPFPQHPHIRVNAPPHAFHNVGMDIAGPLYYKAADQSKKKYWILLLSCLNSRAVSLDVLTDMSTATLLKTIRKFVAVYGAPRRIISDNASSFHALHELQAAVAASEKDNDILDYAASKAIEFHFITPLAPWAGGHYERLIGIMKNSFKAAVGNRLLPLDEVETLLKETQAIVNTRPLTSVDSELTTPPLRPIDFLRPNAPLSLPRLPGENENDDSDTDWRPTRQLRDDLIDTWKRSMDTLNKFWIRWKNEYLVSLRDRYKREHPQPRSAQPSSARQGDVVIIHDDSLERGRWRVGEVIDSTDDFKRSAIVRLPSGGTLVRPLNLLYKFEINKDDNLQEEPEGEPEQPTPPPLNDISTRPRRSERLAKKKNNTTTTTALSPTASFGPGGAADATSASNMTNP